VAQALVAIPFGLAIGLSLGLVGGGGSILAVPVLVYVLGEDVKQATTVSLLVVGATALAGALDHSRRGRVRWRIALLFGGAGAVGSLGGTALNRVVSSDAILVLFGLLLLVSAFVMLDRRSSRSAETIAPRRHGVRLEVAGAGLGVGVLTGFFGVGGGFLVVPALALLLGLPTREAIGTSLLVIVITSAAAFAAHLGSGSVDWALAGAFAAAGVTGALAGGRLGVRLPSRRLAEGFALLVAAVGLFLLVKNLAQLAG
jgi:uncharacterized membrane protein YfcA